MHITEKQQLQPCSLSTQAKFSNTTQVFHRTISVEGLDIFYREAGPKDAPTILLLHGFPSSSHMFRNLIPALATKFHVVAPDYPGFGHSSMPAAKDFDYTFDHLATIVEKFTEAINLSSYSLYVQDYGAPVGYRLAVKHPERVQGLVVQNGNAYQEGLDNDFWNPVRAYWADPSEANAAPLKEFSKLPATIWQYTHGVRDVEAISPDAWVNDQVGLDRAGNDEIQLRLIGDYSTNPGQYESWHEFFRNHQPPTLIVWGKNDVIFPAAGAEPYKRDLKNIEYHLLDTGHFALEEDGALIAVLIDNFLSRNFLDQ